MKKKTIIPISLITCVFCITGFVISSIAYANGNVVPEPSFTMRYTALTADKSVIESKEESYISEDDASDETMEIVIEDTIEDVIEPEPSISEEIVIPSADIMEDVNIAEIAPEPAQTAEPSAEVSVPTSPDPEPIVSTEPEVSAEPVIESAPIITNYISGQLPLGNYAFGSYVGRLSIPSVNIDVAVYHSNAQSVVDASDSSAAYYAYESQPDYANYTFVIADHNYQGFSAIKNCTIGTEAYISTANGTYRYICDRIILNGHNTGYGIADENYNLVYSDEGGIWLQTCNDCWQNDTLIHFHPC